VIGVPHRGRRISPIKGDADAASEVLHSANVSMDGVLRRSDLGRGAALQTSTFNH
jgi:hypothetical protein